MGEKEVLVDTSVLIDIEAGKIRPPEDIIPYVFETCVYEFIRGHKDPKNAKAFLEEWTGIIWADNDVLVTAASIWRWLKAHGQMISEGDIIIGAAAIAKGLPLWTRDEKHFQALKHFGLKIFRK